MRQNCATCLGQRQAHIESVTWQVNRIELFSHFNRCFVARVSCIVTSTVASMQLAICRPGIWGRTVQSVWDYVKSILKLLLGSWANLFICCNRTCFVTSAHALIPQRVALIFQLLLRCTWQSAGPAYEEERCNLSGTMWSAFWSHYLEVEPTCCFVAPGSCFANLGCCFDVIGNRQAQHMRRNAICVGQCHEHFEAVTWKVCPKAASDLPSWIQEFLPGGSRNIASEAPKSS